MHPNRKALARITTIAFVTLLTVLGVAALLAEPLGYPPSEPPPGVIISGRDKVKSKPKPVRKALETRYAAIREAYLLRDPEGVLRMRTTDFRLLTPSGEVWDAATAAEFTREGLAQVDSTLALTFDIGVIDVHGDTAAAEVDQHWVRQQEESGTLRLVDTRVHQRETWVRRGGDWRLWRVDQVMPSPWTVN